MKRTLLLSLFDLVMGAGLGMAFLPHHTGFLIVLIPTIWWWRLKDTTVWQATRASLLFSIATYFVGIFWVTHVLHTFGGLSTPASLFSLLLLALYLALFLPLAVVTARWLGRNSILPFLPLTFYLTETLRGWLMGGFPWNPWALPLSAHPLLMQGAAFIGVTGLSAALLALTTLPYLTRRNFRVTGILILILFLLGILHYTTWSPGSETIRVAAVQPDAHPSGHFAGEGEPVWPRAQKMADALAVKKVDLIVFPESLFLSPLVSREDILSACTAWSEAGHDILLNHNRVNTRGEWFNATSLFTPGRPRQTYDKIHLVPFGEYLPLRSIFQRFGFKIIARALDDFTPGRDLHLLTGKQRYGVSLCYEIIFSEHVLREVRLGADLLVTQTNDSWYGRWGAPGQHFEMASFRAVEFNRPLVRAALTGISGIINGRGEILESLMQGKAGTVTATLPLTRKNTVYYYTAPFLPWFVGLILIVIAVMKRRFRHA